MRPSADQPRRTAALVPVKAFHQAKARLAAELDPASRVALARWTAGQVINALRPLAVFVACDDPTVASWAESEGAETLWGPGLGLNGAIDDGVRALRDRGFEDVIISHADLPLPTALRHLASATREPRIVLVPDRRQDGTNVVVRPCTIELPASYGAGSFRRHLSLALATGLPVTVRRDPQLCLDLDTWSDLRHPMVRSVIDVDQFGAVAAR